MISCARNWVIILSEPTRLKPKPTPFRLLQKLGEALLGHLRIWSFALGTDVDTVVRRAAVGDLMAPVCWMVDGSRFAGFKGRSRASAKALFSTFRASRAELFRNNATPDTPKGPSPRAVRVSGTNHLSRTGTDQISPSERVTCPRGAPPYPTAPIISKIGRYIATIMPPTTTPSTTIMKGSIAARSALTAESTSSS